MSKGRGWSDRTTLLVLGGAMALLLIGVSLFARSTDNSDMRPSVDNAGSAGAKAAYLVLQGLGRNVGRWEQPLSKLDSVDAEHTTLVIADPKLEVAQRKREAADLKRFLERGGHVLFTGGGWASLLPGGEAGPAGTFRGKICFTTPEGPGELARAGEVEMAGNVKWTATGPQFRIEQRCGNDAVVVRFPAGKGEAVWWASSMPLSNAGLKKASSVKLLLASLYGNGEDRKVLFDEYLQELHGEGSVLSGLPLWWLLLQFVIVLLLLIWSFSRRKGPLRMPITLPRTSPVEFAESMGDLYEKAGAVDAATEAARRRLLRTLQREAGIGRAAIAEGPDAIAEALQVRLGGEWNEMAEHLREAQSAVHENVNTRSAFALVCALREDEKRVFNALRPATAIKVVEGELAEAAAKG